MPFLLAAGMGIALLFEGCGTPGAPLAPSLNLPDTVNDLAAQRTGDRVTLTWKMPGKTTDKLLLKSEIPVRVCRKEGSGACATVPGNLLLAPNAVGAFTETLPQNLATGTPRSLSYFVELLNRNGRSAGLSNPSVILAGQAPAPVANLSAKVIKAGVVLRWPPGSASEAIRLHRKLLTTLAVKPKTRQGLMAPEPEPLEQSLLVEPPAEPGQSDRALDRTLDKDVRFDESYEYRAQRVARVTVDDKTLELAGPLSEPVRVQVLDVFPPAVPTGLAAVATLGQAGNETLPATQSTGAKATRPGSAFPRRRPSFPPASTMRTSSPATPIAMPSPPLTRAAMRAPGPLKPRKPCPPPEGSSFQKDYSDELLPIFAR